MFHRHNNTLHRNILSNYRFGNISEKSRGISTMAWLQDIRFYWSKKTLLLKAVITRPRHFQVGKHIAHQTLNSDNLLSIYKLLFLWVGKRVIHLSISEMAGHGSFFFLALSYLENDFLNLRLYALSGQQFLIILFQLKTFL